MPKHAQHSLKRLDVVILGGGLVGGSMACALAEKGMQVGIIDPALPHSTASQDGRMSAISYGSFLLLQRWGIWPLLNQPVEPIFHIRVSQGSAQGVLCYDSEEGQGEALGFMVPNLALRLAVANRMKTFKNVHAFIPDQLEQFQVKETQVTFNLKSQTQLAAPLLIAADGRNSEVRQQLGIQTIRSDYHQHAVIFNLNCSRPHHQTAYEHFLTSGPLAVLPLPHQQVAVVWMQSPQQAKRLLEMPEATLIQGFQSRFGYGLGKLELTSSRQAYPLSLILPMKQTHHRIALIGDAAHVIHPVAGQGVNLGFRDVEGLETLLGEYHHLGLDMGSESLLETFRRKRRLDILSMGGMTHGLIHLFALKGGWVRCLRQMGMAGISRIPSLKRRLISHARGLESYLTS